MFNKNHIPPFCPLCCAVATVRRHFFKIMYSLCLMIYKLGYNWCAGVPAELSKVIQEMSYSLCPWL